MNIIESILPQLTRSTYRDLGIQIFSVALVGYLVYSVLNNNPIPILVVVGGLVLCFLISQPRWSLYLLTVCFFFLDFIASHGFVPQATTWFSDLLIVAFAFRLVGNITIGRDVLLKSVVRIDFWIILMLIASLLSAFVANQQPIVTVLGLRGYFKFVLLFYLILNLDFPLRFLQKIHDLFWLLLFTQPVVVVIQAWTYGIGSADSNGGTMAGRLGGTSVLSVVTGMASALWFAYFLETKKKKYLILALLLLLVLGFAEAKGGYILFGVGTVSTLFFYGLRRRNIGLIWKLVLPAVLLILTTRISTDLAGSHSLIDVEKILGQFVILYEKAGQVDFTQYQTTFRSTQESGEKLGLNLSYIDRMADMQMAMHYTADTPSGGLLGGGPGAGSVSFFGGYSGAIYMNYQDTYGKISDVFWTQFSHTLVEIGYVGLIAYFGIFIGVFSLAYRFYMKCPDPAWRACALSLIGFIGIFFVGTFYHRIGVMEPVLFVFWLSTALIVIKRRQERSFNLNRDTTL